MYASYEDNAYWKNVSPTNAGYVFCLHCRYVHILNESPKGALYCLKVACEDELKSKNKMSIQNNT